MRRLLFGKRAGLGAIAMDLLLTPLLVSMFAGSHGEEPAPVIQNVWVIVNYNVAGEVVEDGWIRRTAGGRGL